MAKSGEEFSTKNIKKSPKPTQMLNNYIFNIKKSFSKSRNFNFAMIKF